MSEDVDNMISDTDNLTSKKTELLRATAREIVVGLVSETILENLEAMEKLERALQGNAMASGSMRAAYCAVAVECTVKLLVAGGGKAGSKYWNAFDRIWNLRIGELEKFGESELVTETVKKWRDDLQSSFSDHDACLKLCAMNTRNEAVIRVRVYLDEEGESMGLSLFESEGVRLRGVNEEEISDEDRVFVETLKASELDVLANVCTSFKYDGVKEHVRASSSKSRMVTAIFSPKAVIGAEIMMSLSTDQTNGKEILENWDEKEVDEANETVHESNDQLGETTNVDVGNTLCENQGNAVQQGLMEHKSSASTYEWSEPIQGSPISIISCERRIHKLSPKRKAVRSSLKKMGRRKSRRWSLHEEDALRTAVERFGRCWKYILTELGDEFDERTEVDLKDKWRNMTKYSPC